MQLSMAMILGLVVGIGLFFATRTRPVVAAWTALMLGLAASVLFLLFVNGWVLPDLGRFGAIGIGLLSGVATALAVTSLALGERRPLNWAALVVAAPLIRQRRARLA